MGAGHGEPACEHATLISVDPRGIPPDLASASIARPRKAQRIPDGVTSPPQRALPRVVPDPRLSSDGRTPSRRPLSPAAMAHEAGHQRLAAANGRWTPPRATTSPGLHPLGGYPPHGRCHGSWRVGGLRAGHSRLEALHRQNHRRGDQDESRQAPWCPPGEQGSGASRPGTPWRIARHPIAACARTGPRDPRRLPSASPNALGGTRVRHDSRRSLKSDPSELRSGEKDSGVQGLPVSMTDIRKARTPQEK